MTDKDTVLRTRGPYRVGHDGSRDQTFIPLGSYYILDGKGDIMGLVCWNSNSGDRLSNARFIVDAMNEKEGREND